MDLEPLPDSLLTLVHPNESPVMIHFKRPQMSPAPRMHRGLGSQAAGVLMASIVGLCLFVAAGTGWAAGNTAFIYQGRLSSGSTAQTGSFDFRFVLWDSVTGGAPVGQARTNLGVAAVNGLFATPIDFGSAVFDGSPRWLEIGVRSSPEQSFVPLTPRQPLAPTPYALHAETAGTVADGAVGSAALAAGAVQGDKLAAGAVGSDKLAAGAAVKSLNGIKDDVVLAAGNNVTLNRSGNTLTIASTGGGTAGVGSVVSGTTAAVLAGTGNAATNNFAVVAGGEKNTAGGLRSVVPGGFNNAATGVASFAAGTGAQAVTDRTFVWAGNQTAVPFTSTGPDQFLVRAGGGIGLNTSSTPEGGLVVEGNIHINKNELYLREGTDHNHGLGYYGGGKTFGTADPDGPVLYGFGGGALGSKSGGAHPVLEWTPNSVKVNGTLDASNLPGIAFVNRYEQATL